MLKITKHDETESTEETTDVVGRFRAGYMVDDEPVSLSAFRVTTGDETLAKKIASPKGLGLNPDVDEAGPQEWDAAGEDFIEVFTKAAEVDVILDSAEAYQSSLIRRDKDDEFMYATDGEVITAVGEDYEDQFEVGDPDPQIEEGLTTRKQKARKNKGSRPDIRIRFRLVEHPEWGVFEYRTSGWSLVTHSSEEKLAGLGEGPIRATLKLIRSKNRRRAYTFPELAVHGLEADVQEKAAVKPKVTGTQKKSPIPAK